MFMVLDLFLNTRSYFILLVFVCHNDIYVRKLNIM